MKLGSPRAKYARGWGPSGANQSMIVAQWTLFIQDMNGKKLSIDFDVTDDNAPIILGLDHLQHATIMNVRRPGVIALRFPGNQFEYKLETYLTGNDPLQKRLMLLVVPMSLVSNTLVTTNTRKHRMRPTTLAARLHHLTHAHPDELKRICANARWLTPELSAAIDVVTRDCMI